MAYSSGKATFAGPDVVHEGSARQVLKINCLNFEGTQSAIAFTHDRVPDGGRHYLVARRDYKIYLAYPVTSPPTKTTCSQASTFLNLEFKAERRKFSYKFTLCTLLGKYLGKSYMNLVRIYMYIGTYYVSAVQI